MTTIYLFLDSYPCEVCCMSFLSRLFSSARPTSAMGVQKASFGAGCFWGTEKFFRKEFNLIDAKYVTHPTCSTPLHYYITSSHPCIYLLIYRVGYQGGDTHNPTYKQVCTGTTGHAEVLVVEYDDTKVNYADLYVLLLILVYC